MTSAISQAAGALALRASDWETAFFGARMGAVTLREEPGSAKPEERATHLGRELRAVLSQATREGYAHLIFRAPAGDLGAVWAAEAAGLRLVDVGVDSTFDVGATPLPAGGSRLATRVGTVADLPVLHAITSGAFRHTRFSIDPFFTDEQVTAFYQQWATNLFAGLADVVLLAEIDGQIAGFVSCAVSDGAGRIPLVATHADFQRRGVGRDLVGEALRWFALSGARTVAVKTQAANYPALALYHRAGFTVSSTELTFSITLRSRRTNQ